MTDKQTHRLWQALEARQRENKISRKTRQLLLTAAVGGALIATPQVARADTYAPTGIHSVTQSFPAVGDPPEATVTVTVAGAYEVDTTNSPYGDAVSITSSGVATYTGNTTTVLKAGTGGIGLNVNSGDAIAIDSFGTISGESGGISATNNSSSDTVINVNGNITGTTGDAIFATKTGAGGNLTVKADNALATISGGANGINANNDGIGYTEVTVSGNVEGGATGDGIHATKTNGGAGALTITGDNSSATISGGVHGIYADNAGTEASTITVSGDVTGGNTGAGIYSSKTGAGDGALTITGNNSSATISGGVYGIYADNAGLADSIITVSGDVTGGNTGAGIYSTKTGTGAGNMVITANSDKTIRGGTGIYAENDGTAYTEITSQGSVYGDTGDGIQAVNNGATSYLTIEANNSSGVDYGISATNSSTTTTSYTDITTNGIVEGGLAGIYAESSPFPDPIKPITITINPSSPGNPSEVRNSSGNSWDPAIHTIGAPTTLTNSGTITGGVTLSESANVFTNSLAGIWNAGGSVSDLGPSSGSTSILNNHGSIRAMAMFPNNTTTVNDVFAVNNSGEITMQNGIEGDKITFTNGGNGTFDGTGNSRLLVDTSFISTNQVSDQLWVDNVSGNTKVYVQVVGTRVDPITQPGDGILVVHVGGDSPPAAPDTFTLPDGITVGLHEYNYYKLRQGELPGNEKNWYLWDGGLTPSTEPGGGEPGGGEPGGGEPPAPPSKTAVGTNMLSILGSRTALSSLSNLHDRERDVDVLSNDTPSKKGVWGRVFGQSNDFHSNESFNTGFDTNLWGAQAGVDLMAKSDADGSRKYAGLYVAYATSSGDGLRDSEKVASLDLDATTLGAYYTKYSSDGWYLDAVAQYSWLNKVRAKTVTDNINSGGSSYALSLEAGRQYKPESKIIREVQAQLIYQNTSIDDVTLSNDMTLASSNLNAVTGRFGLRLYRNPKGGKKFLPWVRANIWHTFANDAKISTGGDTVGTPIGGTSAELQAGFTMGPKSNGGWNLYASGGYLFALNGAEYSGWKGTLGLRKGW